MKAEEFMGRLASWGDDIEGILGRLVKTQMKLFVAMNMSPPDIAPIDEGHRAKTFMGKLGAWGSQVEQELKELDEDLQDLACQIDAYEAVKPVVPGFSGIAEIRELMKELSTLEDIITRLEGKGFRFAGTDNNQHEPATVGNPQSTPVRGKEWSITQLEKASKVNRHRITALLERGILDGQRPKDALITHPYRITSESIIKAIEAGEFVKPYGELPPEFLEAIGLNGG